MGPIAETTHGRVSGMHLPGEVDAYLGIPYAATPTGDRRFHAPQPPESWVGVRAAKQYGLPALQWVTTEEGVFGAVREASEDSLYLNVWTPAEMERPAPVMVWIPGGGFYAGAASSPSQTGATFARDGVVFVSFNYRLGVTGWLDLRDGFPQTAVAPGFLDQIAALRWVQDNIAAFGGDPSNVTVFGCSSGAISVAALLASPAAVGTCHRAIAQSGGGHHYLDPDRARWIGTRFLELTGVRAGDTDELAALSADDLLLAQANIFGEVMQRTIDVPGYGLTALPVLDDEVLPLPPVDGLHLGPGKEVDLLVGSNRDEWTMFDHFDLTTGIPRDHLRSELDKITDGAAVLATYRRNRPHASDAQLVVPVETDRWYRMPAIRLAEAHLGSKATFMYRFAWPTPAFDGALGSCHGLELPFVFDNFDGPEVPALTGANPPRELATAIHTSWVTFATQGQPTAPAVPDWPQYDRTTRSTMEFGLPTTVTTDPDGDERALWSELL